MVLVREVIIETDLVKTDILVSAAIFTMQLPCHSTKTAMNVLQVFLKLTRKTRRRDFEAFVGGFFGDTLPEKQHATQTILAIRVKSSAKSTAIFKNLPRVRAEVEMAV